MKEVYDVLLVHIPTTHTVAPTVTLAQNLLLLLSGRIPARWLCQKRILIENILRNQHETSNKRIQMYGSPERMEKPLMIFMSLPGNQQVFKLKDYDIYTAFLPVNQSLGETLVQNCILLLSKLTSDYWICQERSLIKDIRNLYGDSNKRSQTNGSPDSLANSLVIFMSIPGTPEVFQLKDYGLHTIELGVDLTVENGKITAWKRNHATFEHVELEDDEGANRMAWARIARTPNLPWQAKIFISVIDPRYAHVPDPDQTLTIQEETHRCHEKMDRIYNTGPSTSSS
ncbi:hypothetical protein CAEBREN_03710 [Caenorhabditis brenneri]|uniref:Uncharacterized protein n=1 Tax=Caenorhabditis brenneri TaxID=135651 RepID=G0NEQ9_CAEBE|nr:hypothetical protein CAEBREN_03710 [Caenorhabditis brenneri]